MIPWKDLREIFRAASGMLLSKFIPSTNGVRHQLDADLFVRNIQDPPKAISTIIMIPN